MLEEGPAQGAETAADQLSRLQRTSRALAHALTVEHVADAMVQEAARVPGACAAAIDLLEEDRVVALRRVPFGKPPAVDWQLPSAEEVLAAQPRFEGARISLPLIAQERPIGCLAIQLIEPREIAATERESLEAFADLCAQALDRAWLYESAREARALSMALQALSAALADARTPAEVARLSVTSALSTLGASSGLVGMLTANGREVEIVATAGFVDPSVLAAIQRRPLETRAPVTDAISLGTETWESDSGDGFQPDRRGIAGRLGARSFCALPMEVEGRRVGAIGLGFAEPRRLLSEERAFLLSVVRQCAQAYERTRLSAEALRAHELLEESLRRLPIGVVIASADGRVLVDNDESRRLFGAMSQAQGFADYQRVQGFRPDGSRYRTEDWPLARALRGETVRNEELRAVTPDGRELSLRASAAPIPDESGKPRAGVVTVADVSDAHRAEERDRFLADAAVLLGASLDAGDVLQRLAQLAVPRLADWCIIYRFEDGELRLQTACATTPGAAEQAMRRRDLAPKGSLTDRVGQSGVAELLPEITETTILHAATSEELRSAARTIGFNSALVVPLRGRVGIIGTLAFLNTGERRRLGEADLQLAEDLARRASLAVENARLFGESEQIREELQRTTASLQAVIARSPLALVVLDLDGTVHSWNPAAEQLFGWTAQEALGSFLPYVGAEQRAEYQRNLGRVRDGQVLSGVPVVRYRKDGSSFPARLWASPLPVPGGETLVLAIIADITDERRAEEERGQLLHREQEARAHAEEATRLKDEFLATLSHEMRTPLTAILGWVRMLRARGEVPTQLDHAFETIDRNARAQLQMVEDLLDVSRIVAGKLRLSPRDLHLGEVLLAAAESVQPTADVRGVTLELRGAELPLRISGDFDRLQQITWNLLANAIKFTPAGGKVVASLEDAGDSACLSVRDTGKGIPAAFMPFVFTRFRQADSGTTRLEGGLGLGLAISRHLVEMHGGTIAVESEGEGRGSLFTVRLPKRLAMAAPELRDPSAPPPVTFTSPEEAPSLEGVRVLVVEDDADARELLGLILEGYGASVQLASSASEGLRALGAADFDALLSDVSMPTEDGYSFIRKVRAASRNGAVPAAALTANVRNEDRERALAAGFQMHVGKPIDPAELAHAVARLSGRAQRL